MQVDLSQLERGFISEMAKKLFPNPSELKPSERAALDVLERKLFPIDEQKGASARQVLLMSMEEIKDRAEESWRAEGKEPYSSVNS